MSVPLLVIKVRIFRIISLSIARKQKKYDGIIQTSVKQDDTTRTRTLKPGYLNLSINIGRVPVCCWLQNIVCRNIWCNVCLVQVTAYPAFSFRFVVAVVRYSCVELNRQMS